MTLRLRLSAFQRPHVACGSSDCNRSTDLRPRERELPVASGHQTPTRKRPTRRSPRTPRRPLKTDWAFIQKKEGWGMICNNETDFLLSLHNSLTSDSPRVRSTCKFVRHRSSISAQVAQKMVAHRTSIVDHDSPHVARHSKLGQSQPVFQSQFSIFIDRCLILIDAWQIRSSLGQFAFKRLSPLRSFSSFLSVFTHQVGYWIASQLTESLIIWLHASLVSIQDLASQCYYHEKATSASGLMESLSMASKGMEARQYLTKSVGSLFVFGGGLHVYCQILPYIKCDFSRSPWPWH